MNRIATIAAASLIAAAAYAAPAHAAGGVSATYGCRSITFTNNTKDMVKFNYGTNNSDDPGKDVVVAAKGTKTITLSKSEASFIGWDAESLDGKQLQDRPGWGTDLNKLCTTAKPSTGSKSATSKPTASAGTGSKSASGGVAKTGF